MPRKYTRKYRNAGLKRKLMARRSRPVTVRKVKQLIRASEESKYIETALSSVTSPISGTGSVVYISGCAQGTTAGTRVGDDIKISSIQIQGDIKQDITNDNASQARLVLVRETGRGSGTNIAITDVLEADSVNSFRNKDNDNNWRIYMDKKFVLTPVITNTKVTTRIKYYKRFKHMKPQKYEAGSAAVADAGTGGWFLLLITDQPTDNQPIWTMNVRLIFKE